MKDIFHDLYNKVLSFFTNNEESVDPTKGVAVSRLKTVLLQDRVGFSERAIQMMKEELVTVVSKYMEIDEDNFQLQIDAMDDKTVLGLSIPVMRAKTDDEIDDAIKEQDLKNQKKAEEIVKELENLIKEKAIALADGEIDKDLIEQAQKNIKDKEEAEEEENQTEETTPAENKIEDETLKNSDVSEDNEAEKAVSQKASKKKK